MTLLPDFIRDFKDVPDAASRCTWCRKDVRDKTGGISARWYVDGFRCCNTNRMTKTQSDLQGKKLGSGWFKRQWGWFVKDKFERKKRKVV